MHSPGRGALRWLRAGVLVSLTVLLSIAGHVLAGGAVHLSGPAVMGGLALAAMCVAAADAQRGVAEILPVVLVAQPVLHLLASMGGHEHAAALVAAPAPAVPPVGAPPAALMVAGHVAAAVVLSLLLAYADQLVWAMAGRRPRVRSAVVLAPLPARGPVVRRFDAVSVPARTALRDVPVRRGPPVAAAAR